MSEKTEITFNLFKSILFGLLFPAVFCWLTIWDPLFLNPIKKDLRLIFQKKIVTNGIITDAKWFEDAVESYGDKYVHVDGYEYSYAFNSNKGEKFTSESSTYQELPNNKQISEIPFQVKIEYLEDNPKVNRIAGLPSNNESLWDMLRNTLILPLLFFTMCCYFSFLFIKPALVKYRIESKKNKERLKMAEIEDFNNQTYFNEGKQESKNRQPKATPEQRKIALQKILIYQREQKKLNENEEDNGK